MLPANVPQVLALPLSMFLPAHGRTRCHQHVKTYTDCQNRVIAHQRCHCECQYSANTYTFLRRLRTKLCSFMRHSTDRCAT
ncbi:hypothetical protein BD769DRAFT_1485655 [Suillus cothurnatus]|nr:hypothetical protein BD769DRAFT_1485655 [Suillus cothurnatus]